MKNLTDQQISEIKKIAEFSSVNENHIVFSVTDQAFGEHSKEADAIFEKLQAIVPDLDGYLQGHPLDAGDMGYIYFSI